MFRKRKIQADKMQDEAYELTGKVHKSSAKLAGDVSYAVPALDGKQLLHWQVSNS